MLGLVLGGSRTKDVVAELACNTLTVRRDLSNFNTIGSTKERLCCGRPKILSRHQKKICYRKAWNRSDEGWRQGVGRAQAYTRLNFRS